MGLDDAGIGSSANIIEQMVKKAVNDTLEYLADNLKARAEQLAAG